MKYFNKIQNKMFISVSFSTTTEPNYLDTSKVIITNEKNFFKWVKIEMKKN